MSDNFCGLRVGGQKGTENTPSARGKTRAERKRSCVCVGQEENREQGLRLCGHETKVCKLSMAGSVIPHLVAEPPLRWWCFNPIPSLQLRAQSWPCCGC